MSLPVSRLVKVDVNLSPLPAAGRSFGRLMIAGDSNVISGLERIRDYDGDLTSIGKDFGITSAEYLAAQVYFAQKPQPQQLSIARWLRTATAAILNGTILSAAQQTLFNFTQVTSGGFSVTVDGVVKALTALNFSAQTNLNGVASVITTALAGAGTCIWNGAQFVISSATTGAGVAASGTMTLTGQPSNNDTVVVNGITVTFVNTLTTGNQVLIGSSSLITAANLNAFLANSVSPNILAATYSINALVVTATYASVGTGGNAFTLTKSCANMNLSAATLMGGVNASSMTFATAPGSGTDVSALLGLTSALALPLVPGYNSESASAAIAALSAKSTKWYGSMFGASVMPSTSENLLIAAFIEADPTTRIFGVTTQDSNTLSSLVTNDYASQLKAGGYEQSFCQYSSTNINAVASMFGRAFSVNFAQQNSTIDLMYKQEPLIQAEVLSTDQANVLQSKRCNVYVSYNNDTSILQYGVMSGPAFFDEIHGLDWLANAIQTACFNVLYTSNTKVPQTDQGDNQFVNAISGVCDQGIFNGLGAPGQWNAPGFGQLQEGQYLKYGYYVFIQPVALQSQSDRAARKAPPAQVAFKLAGSNQTVDVLVNVNR